MNDLEALELLRTRDICLVCLKNAETFRNYALLIWFHYGKNIKIDISEKEFDLLKKVLK